MRPLGATSRSAVAAPAKRTGKAPTLPAISAIPPVAVERDRSTRHWPRSKLRWPSSILWNSIDVPTGNGSRGSRPRRDPRTIRRPRTAATNAARTAAFRSQGRSCPVICMDAWSNIIGSARPARSAGPHVLIRCWFSAVCIQEARDRPHPGSHRSKQCAPIGLERNSSFPRRSPSNISSGHDVSRCVGKGRKGRAGAEEIRRPACSRAEA
jgi:hypothetical protein